MYKGIRWISLHLLFFIICGTQVLTQEVEIQDTLWNGSDFIIQLSDSVSYEVDLTESDSSTLVIRFSSSLGSDITSEEHVITSSDGIMASLSRDKSDGIRILTIQKGSRFGYSTLWRPYSHRLIVHTFDWNSLNDAETIYHRGLLSLEQGLPELAKEQFSAARAISEDSSVTARRATSLLGILYAREGKDSLAMEYLSAPLGPDDYMARAEARRRSGNNEGAAEDERTFQGKINSDFSFADSPTDGNTSSEIKSVRTEWSLSDLLKDSKGILLLVLAAIVIIGLATWFARKPASVEQESQSSDNTSSPEPKLSPQPPVKTPEVTTPPNEPAKDVLESTDPRTASVVAPEIILDTKEIVEDNKTPEEPSDITLPKPDALPTETPETEAEENNEPAEEDANAEQASRSSTQADMLRQRMATATTQSQGETDSPVVEAKPEDESTISKARKLNVSRDYVELRNRIAELRQRIGSTD